MGTHMKTTIEISDPLFAKAKAIAQKENTTLRSLVEQGLQQVIREHADKKAKPFRLKKASVKGSGLTPEAIARGGWGALRDLSYDPDFR
jgi:hypothetical protein